MADFFQTQMGHKFYESTMPRIATALESLVETLGKQAPGPSIPPALPPSLIEALRVIGHVPIPGNCDRGPTLDEYNKAIDYIRGYINHA